MKATYQIETKSTFFRINFTVLVILSSFIFLDAQSSVSIGNQKQEIITSVSEGEGAGSELSAFRAVPGVDATFTGYKIAIMQSVEVLEANHPIFSQFGKIKQLNYNGVYYYLIGSFSNPEYALSYGSKVLSTKYPDYKIMEFVNGEFVENNSGSAGGVHF